VKEDGTFELGEKLSREDHDLLRSYWDVTSLRRNAQNLGVDSTIAVRAEFWSYEEYEERVANAEREAAENAEANPQPEQPEAVPGGSSTPVPASVSAQQATGTGLVADGNGDGPTEQPVRAFADAELAAKPYEDWTKAQLTAEITKRNEMRDGDEDYADEEPMATDGNKDVLVSRLKEDDEADAPASE